MMSNLCIYCKIMKRFESITSLRFAHASKYVSLLFWCLPENGKDYTGSSVLLKSNSHVCITLAVLRLTKRPNKSEFSRRGQYHNMVAMYWTTYIFRDAG